MAISAPDLTASAKKSADKITDQLNDAFGHAGNGLVTLYEDPAVPQHQKINLFTMTIGALETVLAEAQEGEIDLEERILEIVLGSANGDELRAQVQSLGDELLQAMGRQRAAESLTVEALG